MSGHEPVFLDSNGWIALLNRNDFWHERAVEESLRIEEAQRPLVATDWIVAEMGNGLAKTAARGRLVDAVGRFLESSNSRLIRVNGELFQEALGLYHRSDDKSWGLVDCASFVVMRRERIMDAFTTDRHFRQAGFRPLLAAQPR